MFLPAASSAMLFANTSDMIQQVFGGDVPIEPLSWYQVAARAALVYLAGLVVVRVGKSRLISRTTSLDVIIGFILGSLLSRGITGHASISGTIIASAVVVAVHWVLTYIACRWHGFGNLLKGNPELVVENGRVHYKAMRHSHISDHDLIEQLRLRGVDNLHEVRAAFKERNGEISVLAQKEEPRILDVAVQNGVQTVRIALQ
jgi:uncharacterized membrane protein YcaP (DUF421 family)